MASISASPGAASSSSSASTDDGLAALIDESLGALRRDRPEAYRETVRRLERGAVRVEVGGERLLVGARGGGHELRAATDAEPGCATLVTRPDVLVALLDGEARLLDCMLDDRLFLAGSIDALLRLEEALAWYLRGAVRSAAFPGLVRRLRAWSRRVAAARGPTAGAARGPTAGAARRS
jgi:hypothetical protein